MVTKLTRAEALRALADGKKVYHELWSDLPNYIWWNKEYGWMETNKDLESDLLQDVIYNLINQENGWLLHEEEPKQERLATTLEEALQCKKLLIHWPAYLTKVPLSVDNTSDYILTLPLLHAALSLPGARVVIEA